MATIKDIARETGLGLATISKYLNGGNLREQNKIAIEAAIDRLGFTINGFARGLKTNKSRTIGVLIPELNNLFITTIITVIEDILRKQGYGVIICDCRTDKAQEREAARFLMGKSVDGIISMPVSRSGEYLLPLIEKNIPAVLLDRMIPSLKGRVDAVLTDNAGAAEKAVKMLLNFGHKRIGVILGPRDVFTSQQRLLGYSRALSRSVIQEMENPCVLFSDYTVQGGYRSMKRLLSDPQVTAVFATNYEMTLGAIIAVNELRIKVPEQISFIGFDNLQLSQIIQPKITIITQPMEEIGKTAAEILLQKFSREGAETGARVITLPTGMSLGESVENCV